MTHLTPVGSYYPNDVYINSNDAHWPKWYPTDVCIDSNDVHWSKSWVLVQLISTNQTDDCNNPNDANWPNWCPYRLRWCPLTLVMPGIVSMTHTDKTNNCSDPNDVYRPNRCLYWLKWCPLIQLMPHIGSNDDHLYDVKVVGVYCSSITALFYNCVVLL